MPFETKYTTSGIYLNKSTMKINSTLKQNWNLVLLIIIIGFMLINTSQAQDDIVMSNGMINTCNATFTDSGGVNGDYGPDEDFTFTICSDDPNETHIQIVFPQGITFAEGDSTDVIYFYDSSQPHPDSLLTSYYWSPNAAVGAFTVEASAINRSGCITVVFNSGNAEEAAGWFATVQCVSACQFIETELLSTTPASVPIDTGWIDVCVGEEIDFSARGIYPQNDEIYHQSDELSIFEWNFGDGIIEDNYGSNTGSTTTQYSFSRPGGYLVNLTIEDQNGCRSTNFINQRVRVSGATDFILPNDIDFEICTSDTINIESDLNSNTGIIVNEFDTLSFIRPGISVDSIPLPDGVGVSYESSISYNIFPVGATLTDINDLLSIYVIMEHSWMYDLDIFIQCPNGQQVELHNFIGNPGDEVYIGDPETSNDPELYGLGDTLLWTNSGQYTWIEYAMANMPHTLPAMEYASFESLDGLLGCPLNGEWSIIVTDNVPMDNGWLFQWGIELQEQLYPEQEIFHQNVVDWGWDSTPSVINMDSNSLQASPPNAGVFPYTFWVEDNFGCRYDTTLEFNVLPELHPACFSCQPLPPANDSLLICARDTTMIQSSLVEVQGTVVSFESFPASAISHNLYPVDAPDTLPIHINSIWPDTIYDPLVQIESICLDIEAINVGELSIFLMAPSGQILPLSTQNGGLDNNYTNTCFSPSAIDDIAAGVAPFTGSYQPEGNWNSLIGADINGDWNLLISDQFGDDIGEVVHWNMTFNSQNELTHSWMPVSALECTDCDSTRVFPAVTTDYVVEARDIYGCEQTNNWHVEVLDTLEAPSLSCAITGNGIMQFNWDQPNPQIDQYDFEIEVNGTVVQTETAYLGQDFQYSGLAFQDSVVMRLNAYWENGVCNVDTASTYCVYNECPPGRIIPIDTVLIDSVSCFGLQTGAATVVISETEYAPYSFVWNDPQQQLLATASFLAAGDYEVLVSDSAFCQRIIEVHIPEPAPLVIDVQTEDVSCKGGDDGVGIPLPQGGIAPYGFIWDGMHNIDTIRTLSTGLHSVEITDANGCMENADFMVAEPVDFVSATVTQSYFACNGEDNNEMQIIPSGGTGTQYTISWDDGQVGYTATSLSAGEIGFTVFDENNCTFSDTVTVGQLDTIFANLIVNPPSCNGQNDGIIGVNTFGGGAGQEGVEADYSFEWNDNLGNGLTLSNIEGGLDYNVTITDAQGCSNVFHRYLSQPDPIEYETDSSPVSCFGEDDGSAELINIQGTQGMPIVQWDAFAGNQNGLQAVNLLSGTYTFTITDGLNCSQSGSVTVDQPSILTLQLSSENSDCTGNDTGVISTQVGGGIAPYTYQWSNGAQSAMLQQLGEGVYTVTVTDANMCQVVGFSSIEGPPPLEVVIETDTIRCNGGRNGRISITPIGGTPPFMYSMDGLNYTTSNTFIGLTAGSYPVYIQNAQGCLDVVNAEVIEPEPLVIDAGGDVTMLLGDTITISAMAQNTQGDVLFVWYPPYNDMMSCEECPTADFYPQNTALVELFGEDENGCEGSDYLRITVEKPRLAVVPSGFTPNNDGANDRLLVHGLPGTRVISFKVFDRWGELVFENSDFEVNDINQGWDGTFRGADADGGVYVWYLEVEYPFDFEQNTTFGETTLIR